MIWRTHIVGFLLVLTAMAVMPGLARAAADNASVRPIGPVARHPIHSTIHPLMSTSQDFVCGLPQNGHTSRLFITPPLVCHQYMKIRDEALDLDDGVTTPSAPLRGYVSG